MKKYPVIIALTLISSLLITPLPVLSRSAEVVPSRLDINKPVKIGTLAIAIRPTSDLDGMSVEDLKALGLIKEFKRTVTRRISITRVVKSGKRLAVRPSIKRRSAVSADSGLSTNARFLLNRMLDRTEAPIESPDIEPVPTQPLKLSAKAYYTIFVPQTYFVRNGGGNTTQCTGLASVDYDGSGSGEACAFSNPQSAYNAATFGDTIKLTAGQTFSTPVDDHDGEWALSNKGTPPTNTDADYITITTTDTTGTPAALSGYPATRTRITDAMAVNMPKVVAEGATPLFRLKEGAKYWRIERLEWTNDSTNGWQTIVFLHTDDINSLAAVPHHIEVRYNWIHPDEETGVALSAANEDRSAENAIYLTATDFAIHHNAIQGFVGLNRYGGEVGRRIASSAVLIPTYAERGLIEHNLLEGWTYAFFAGGSAMPDWTVTEGGTITSCSSATVCTFSSVTGLAVGEPVSVRVATVHASEPSTVTHTDGSITASDNTLTKAFTGANFSVDDVGKKIVVTGAGVAGADLTTKIAAYNSELSIELTTAASTTVSSVSFQYGAQWGAAFVAGIAGNVVTFAAPVCHSYDGNNTCATLFGTPVPTAGDKIRWDGVQPNDILVRRNVFAHYANWADLTDAVSGDTGDCGGKGYLEVKSCTDCEFIGNVFTGCTGPTITVRNQGADFAWVSLNGLNFESNLWEGSNRPFTTFLRDSTPTKKSSNVRWHNNLILGLNSNPAIFAGGELSGNTGGGINVSFTHNTVAWSKTNQPGMSLNGWHNFVGFFGGGAGQGNVMEGFVFRDNIVPLGVNLCFDGEITIAMSNCWPSATVINNVFVNADGYTTGNYNEWWITPNASNTLVGTGYAGVGFAAPNSTLTLGVGTDYRLSGASPFKNTASDGTDPGYNHSALVTALGFDFLTGGAAITICKWSTSPRCQ